MEPIPLPIDLMEPILPSLLIYWNFFSLPWSHTAHFPFPIDFMKLISPLPHRSHVAYSFLSTNLMEAISPPTYFMEPIFPFHTDLILQNQYSFHPLISWSPFFLTHWYDGANFFTLWNTQKAVQILTLNFLSLNDTPHIHLTIIRSVLFRLCRFSAFVAHVSVPYDWLYNITT